MALQKLRVSSLFRRVGVDEGALDGVLVDVGKNVWRADEDGASADDGHCEEDDQLQPVNDRRCVAPVVQNLQHTIDTQHMSNPYQTVASKL